ncbi:MAG: glycosyltransferase family 2 protein [Saprospiraceae bacterium]|nr:glycosyltransferase family 2 protein [Saprospiraceae bacterium]
MIGSYARNVGLLVSKGDWIAYLDDDDIWENDHIEKLYNLTQSKEDVEFVYGGYKRQNQDGTWTIREKSKFHFWKKTFWRNIYST